MKKILFLLLALGVGCPTPNHLHADDSTSHSAAVKCNCPPDCDCHQAGGTCPDGVCVDDCACDKIKIANKTPWIHEDVKALIEQNKTDTRSGMLPGRDYIFVNRQKQFTGYRPTAKQYEGAKFESFTSELPKLGEEDPIPKELDLRLTTKVPMRRQGRNDCWAQGTTSCMEYTVSNIDGIEISLSVQDIIECSDMGSAASGGNIAVNYLKKAGIALAIDYPYTAKDARCREVERHFKPLDTGFVRGKNSGRFTYPDLQRAIMKYAGALVVCGSAGALGNGGWVSRNPGGSTNHCYSMPGWLDGESHGKPAGSYGIMHNSWGADWGDGGFGYYLLAKDGVKLDGSVVTEAAFVYYKDPVPPKPIVFNLDLKDVTLEVTMQTRDWTEASLTEALKAAYAEMEE